MATTATLRKDSMVGLCVAVLRNGGEMVLCEEREGEREGEMKKKSDPTQLSIWVFLQYKR
jgi:hypothetical protein